MVIINNYGKNAQFSVIKMPNIFNPLDLVLGPLCSFSLCKEVYVIKSCITCTLSVQKEFFFPSCSWCCWYLFCNISRASGPNAEGRLQLKQHFFCCCCSHSNILKSCLKRNVGTVFWKCFWEPCTTGEVKNLIVPRGKKDCRNLSPSPCFVTMLVLFKSPSQN